MDSDYPRIETVVVDNDSKDGTNAIVREKYEAVSLIQSKTNLRWAAGNNLGIKNSHGELFFLLNADATIRKDCVSAIVAAWLQDPAIGIIGCKIFFPDGHILQSAGGQIRLSGRTPLFGAMELDSGQHELVRDVGMVSGAAMMISRNALRRVGPFDSIYQFYYEETDICWRVREAGIRVIYLPTANAYHFEGHAMGGSSPRGRYLQASRVVFVLKNYNRDKLMVWVAREVVDFFSNVKRKLVHQEARGSVRNLMFAYFYFFKVLPHILRARLRGREHRS